MNKRIRFILLSLLVWGSVNAQDAHFSQYFNNPLTLNPAMAGNGIEYVRVTAIYRNQWMGLGTPFTTQGFAIDKVVNRVGIGGFITRNGAGDESIKTINLVGNLSYHLPLGPNSTLSGGIQLGMVNKSFDPNKLTFDNQYNPDIGYDPTQSSGEDFISTNVTRPDVNAGIMWQRGWLRPEIRFKPFAGFAASHVNQPGETYIYDITRAQMKTTVYGGFGYLLNDRVEIRPTAILMNQGPAREITFGGLVNYQFNESNQFQLGAYHRMEDAIIAYAGYQISRWFVGLSYDVNTSSLHESGRGTNAFEISLNFTPRPKPKKEKNDKIVTPAAPRADALSHAEMIELPVVYYLIPDVLEGRTQVEPAATPVAETQAAPVAETPVAPVVVTPEPVTEIPPVQVEVTPPAETIADGDQDGVPDDQDECPYIKGSIATHGCPDSDGDGITDLKDKCPMESGSAANYGCPDPNVPVTTKKQELVSKYDNILFATGRTKMTTDDIYDIIEHAIDLLYADKSLHVILSGHTDSEGNAYNNMVLSQARADVVKAYMVRQGIDPSRIETVAYGETVPLENNTSREGKRLNRRVEINLVK